MKRVYKQIFTMVLCAALLIPGLPALAVVAFDGDGTALDPWIIETAAQLALVQSHLSGHFKLGNDIDLSIDYSAGWTPISTFNGTFDGDGHKITGLFIDDDDLEPAGLFGRAGAGSVIKNLGVEGAVNAKGYAGGIVGTTEGVIENCYSACDVEGTGDYVGGIAGKVDGNLARIANCYAAGDISGHDFVGGIVGSIDGTNGIIEYCYATGDISGNNSVGGIVGWITSGSATVRNCAALNPSVESTQQYSTAGRVAGGSSGDTLANNYAFDGMTVTIYGAPQTPATGGTALDGADMSKQQANTASFWTSTLAWSESDWNIVDNSYPILSWQAPETPPPPGGDGGDETYYTTVTFEMNGGSEVKSQLVAYGAKVSKPADPVREGFDFAGWYSDKDLTKEYDFGKSVTGSITLYAGWIKDDSDVSALLNTTDHMAYVHGVGGGNFAPLETLTRAEAAQIFYNLLRNQNVPLTATFPDVADGAWYREAVGTLASLGILTGYPDGGFHPNEPLTRAQLAAIAVRFARVSPGEARFSDVPETHWAYDYISTAAKFGWIESVGGGAFEPDRSITRAEAVTLVNRMLRRYPDEAYIDAHNDLIYFADVDKALWAFYEIAEASNGHLFEKDGTTELWK